jgi:twitching motility protein PilT
MPAIDLLLDEVVKRGGTDLHLAVNQPPFVRVRGELAVLREALISAQTLEEVLLELVTPAQRAKLAADLELELSVQLRDVARFRASYYVKHSGIAAAFRMVPLRVPALASLGCPEVVRKLAERQSGLVLFAGPAASGKTTTMAAFVDHINKTRACHIVTIESPIELVHEPQRAQITQHEIGLHAPSIAAALRNVERESPDVVAISELSTSEEVELALRLAADGVLVLATYAADGAVAALDRLLAAPRVEDQVRIRGLVAESLAAVVVQHLVRTVDATAPAVVHEVLIGTPTIASLLRQGKTDGLAEAMMAGASVGMQTLDDTLEQLVTEGRIAPETALELSVDKVAFARALVRVRPELASSLG